MPIGRDDSLRFPRLFRIQTQPAFSADQIKGEQAFPLMKDLWCTYMMGLSADWYYLGVMSLLASFRHGQATSLLSAACSWSRQQSNWSRQCLLREATQRTFPGCSQLLWLDPQSWSREAGHLLQQASVPSVLHLACPKMHKAENRLCDHDYSEKANEATL